MTELRPAVFLDRDGTIIEDRGDLSHPSQVLFFSQTATSLQQLQKYYSLFIVTNQSGVARGVLSLQDVDCVNMHIVLRLADAGVRIVETYVCPHRRIDGCPCIKPNPYFLLKAQEDHGIDLQRSFVIGDHPSDVDLATNAGARGIYVLSGHGAKHQKEIGDEVLVASGIRDAIQLILQQKDAEGQNAGRGL